MALKIGSISRKPELVWWGGVHDTPAGWAPLLRGLQADYRVCLSTDQDSVSLPGGLTGLQNRQPTAVVLTLDLTGPGRGVIPASGHLVHLPVWDFSTMPEAWELPLLNGADGIWLSSAIQMAGFAQDGYPSTRMAVVTPGVDLTVFTPDAAPAVPAGAKGCRLLCVTDMTWNGDVETLVTSYAAEFMAAEDVTLIIADIDKASPQLRKAALQQVATLAENTDAPHILRLALPMDASARAALIRSADVVVYLARDAAHPWPVIEALACGVPVLVPAEGPTAAVAPADVSWTVAGRRLNLAETQVGSVATRGHTSFFQVNGMDLRRMMRQAVEHTDERAVKASAARAAAEVHGWPAVIGRVRDLIAEMLTRPLVREQVQALTRAFSTANEAFIRQEYEEVRRLLEPYAAIAPAAPDYFALLGSAQVFTGNPTDAVTHLSRALQLNPRNANFYNVLGVALFQLKESALAKRFFEAALVLSPDHPGARQSLTDVNRQMIGKSRKLRERIGDGYAHLLILLKHTEAVPAVPARLSVSMIVKNEEKLLGKALASVKNVADEMIVLDTGSTDRTVEIALEMGAKVFHFDWTGDFAEARNASLDHCTGDWVLALDGDEELVETSEAALRQLISRPLTARPMIYLPRIINLINDNEADAIEHYGPRLFQRVPEMRWTGRIHEQIHHATLGDAGVDRLRVPDLVLNHYGYNAVLMAEKGKEARNFALLDRVLKEEPESPFHHFNMGVALRVADRLAEAIPYFRQAIELCVGQGITPMYMATAYNYLIASLVSTGRLTEAIEMAGTCEYYCQDQPDYWLNMGIAHDKLGDNHAAIKMFERCLDLRSSSAPILADRGAMTWKPYAGIGSAYLKLGETEKGERYLRMAIKENPKNMDLRKVLLGYAIQRGEFVRVESDLRGMLTEAVQPERRVVYQDLANLLLSRARPDDAVLLLEGAVAEAVDHAAVLPGAVSDLARCYQMTDRKDQALSLMQQYRMQAGVFEALSGLYCSEKDWPALSELCDALLANGIGEAFAHAYRGVARFEVGEVDAAEADFRAAIALNEGDYESWNNLGVVALHHEKIDEAEICYRKALVLQPKYFTASFDLGKIAQHRGDLTAAYAFFQQAVAAQPSNVEALVRVADLGDALEIWDESEQYWIEAIHAEPADSNHWVSLGYHYLKRTDPRAALRVLGEALAMTKGNPAVFSGLGIILLELGQFEDARNAFMMAVQLRPEDTEALRGFQIADQMLAGANV
ncbi:MAG: tetratricopeptide repeat protein [Candidatus Sericytochromatia bacterium]|nr:tetratricopeptide repeat protein [Candidatus Sericytochromatia bacterium]